MPIRLNLACGTSYFEGDGWKNLDVVPKWPCAERSCDIVWDARKDKLPFADATVDEVYAGFLLLHLAPKYHAPLLDDIRRVMIPGARFRIVEVDMPEVMKRYIENPFDTMLSELIWGEQGTMHGDLYEQYDKHCQGFTPATLQTLLAAHGFHGFSFGRNSNPGVFWEFTLTCVKS